MCSSYSVVNWVESIWTTLCYHPAYLWKRDVMVTRSFVFVDVCN
jgi:hypothetical protein